MLAACCGTSAPPRLFTGIDHVPHTQCCSYGRIAANDTALFFRLSKLVFPLPGNWQMRDCVLDAFHEEGLIEVEALRRRLRAVVPGRAEGGRG